MIDPLYLLAFLASFMSVGLRGFQHKNVIRNMYWLTAVTSFAIAVTEVLIIGLIVKSSSMTIAVFNGLGAALGMVLAMYLHNRLFGKRETLEK